MNRRPRHPVVAWLVTALAAAVLIVLTFRAWMVWVVVLLVWFVFQFAESRRNRGGQVPKE